MPRAVLYEDWASNSLTATSLYQAPDGAHPGPHGTRLATWEGALAWAGSEAASGFGGYLEGALEAAEAAVSTVLLSPRMAARL